MRLQDGKVVADELDNKGIALLLGEALPETGMAPGELKAKITAALTRKRADQPDMDFMWDILDAMLKDIDRLAALN
jgi:hypothetical protein